MGEESGAEGAARRGARGLRSLLAAAVLTCVAAALLPTACSLPGSIGGEPAADDGARTLELARHEFARAAQALQDGARGGFMRWLPGDAAPDSERARDELGEVFDVLSPLPWRSFVLTVTPLAGQAGVYRVVGSGQLGAAGPADRLAVVRYLKLSGAADAALVLADETPEGLRRRYLMALHDPVVLQRPGLVVLADAWARGRARAVAAAAARARPRLQALGLDARPPIVLTVYGSAEDVRDALAVRLPTARLRFFAHPPLRVAGEEWAVDDVGVNGPWLRDPDASLDDVLTHELAHAYTARWFVGDPAPPALLVEGIAAAAEAMPVSPGLRREVVSGNQLWPLPESFAVTDVWDGGDAEAVGLGYELGRSLVDYVDARWGAPRLEGFARCVAAAEPTEAGLDVALGGELGVTWREFYAGWRRFVVRGG